MSNKDKSSGKVEEIIAGAGGFIYAGYYILTGGNQSNGLLNWLKLIAISVLISIIIYTIFFLVKSIRTKKREH